LTHRFGDFSPWSLGCFVFRTVPDRISWQEAYDGANLLITLWPGSKERGRREPESQYPLHGCTPNDLTSPY
jgi:hypothetical protein